MVSTITTSYLLPPNSNSSLYLVRSSSRSWNFLSLSLSRSLECPAALCNNPHVQSVQPPEGGRPDGIHHYYLVSSQRQPVETIHPFAVSVTGCPATRRRSTCRSTTESTSVTTRSSQRRRSRRREAVRESWETRENGVAGRSEGRVSATLLHSCRAALNKESHRSPPLPVSTDL